jgi:hypothetical protein
VRVKEAWSGIPDPTAPRKKRRPRYDLTVRLDTLELAAAPEDRIKKRTGFSYFTETEDRDDGWSREWGDGVFDEYDHG